MKGFIRYLELRLVGQGEAARSMYKISKDRDGIVLFCQDCAHTERVESFSESLGSRRTQAARAMQNHLREKHGAGSVLKPIPHDHGVMKQ
jgi:hypothetical protein